MGSEALTKECTGCFKVWPLGDFGVARTKSMGRNHKCKKCVKAYTRNRRLDDPVFADKERRRAALVCPGRRRASNLKQNGAVFSSGVSMLPPPDQNCELCGSGETGSKYSWHKDHCHATGRLRGWLCAHCNLGLGRFQDSPTKLVQALNYLGRHGIPMTLEDFQTLIQPVHHNTYSENSK